VGSLLFLARARRTKVQLDRQTIDVADELHIICTYFEAPALEAELKLSCAVGEGVALSVDRTLFQRAVGNLIANAIAHTPAGGHIAVSAARVEDVVRVEVRDDGEGMAPEAQARVFERFYRVDSARTATSGRIGLGLSITKSILELHGGAVRLESALGVGTRIQLDFPV
jgi:two-component system heavy metal sensor histidine kinase CusS